MALTYLAHLACMTLTLVIMFTSQFNSVHSYRDHDHDDDENQGRRYVPPAETRGVLLKHAGIEVDLGGRHDPDDPAYVTYCPRLCSCQGLKVYCDGMELTHLPRYIPQEAEVLMLKENNIKRIWQRPLAGLEAVKHFNIKKNLVRYIEPSAFVDMTQLNSLNLMENRIRYLSPMTFSRLKNLQFLSIKNNRLKEIEGLFRKLHRLHLLNIGGNLIRKITERTFKHNPNLRVLDLHHNRIRVINKHAFRHLPLLKFLILRDNPLTQVDMDFKLNFHLELLDFTNCKLTRMVRGLPHSIKDLRLAENAITKLEDDDFKTTRKIRLLVLTDNKIESISEGAFHRLWQLYDLYLNKNKIKSVPQKLPRTLHGLYAGHNRITEIDKTTFRRTPNLEFLYLKANRIKKVDTDSFGGLNKLKSLDLSKNGLYDLHPSAFSNMSRLQLLDLSDNPLDHMEQSSFNGLNNLHILQMSSVSPRANWSPIIFKEMKHLLYLDLHNSSALVRHLAENPYVLNYLRSVESLNIIDGGLYSLPRNFPKFLPKLKSVKMVGNPWHCDRSIYWLTLWMRRGHVKFYRPENMLCASPPELRGKMIQELLVDELPTVPPPRKQRPDLEVVDIPIKHTYTHNITLTFNLTREGGTATPAEASIQHSRNKKKHGTRIKFNMGRGTKKTKLKRPANDVIMGDSGTLYSSGNTDPVLQENIKTALEEEEDEVEVEDSKLQTLAAASSRRAGGRPRHVEGDGSGTVRGVVSQHVLGESSGEVEPFLT